MKTVQIWYIVTLIFCIVGLSLQLKPTRRKPTVKAPSGSGHPGPSGNPGHAVKPVHSPNPGKPAKPVHPPNPGHPGKPVHPPGQSGHQSTCAKKEKCTIDVRHMKAEHALIVDPTDHNKLVYPARNGKIVIDQGHNIYLVCSGVDNKFVKFTGQYHKFTCECGSTFKSTAPNVEYDFEDLTCSSIPEATFKPKGSKSIPTAAGQATIDRFDVGFKTDASNGFVTVLESHHNSKAQLTSYVKSHVPKSINVVQLFDWSAYFETHPGRFVQVPHKHHRVSLHKMYYAEDQKTSFGKQFPQKNIENKEKGLLLDRGHLAPRRDMIYVPEGLATYTYINTIPQWNSINQHNWEITESYVRNMATTLHKDLTVITGSYKRLHYPDEKTPKIPKNVYLYYDDHGPQLPVPRDTYKIVIDPDAKKGLVFVTSNDPYLAKADITPEYRLCTETLKLDDLEFKTIIKHGYSYVCSVKAFLDKTGLRYLFGEEVLSVNGNLNEAHIVKPS
ncbi:hypothetical protein TKK_0000648 [Trichogramma kaykai]|uniref:DNA/RNA non-specific endonuclease/pyrophosphatase/phosphodiesterase domain-containing protein n=1 Tax=Trichogramma kaykai TaxID=54128 RepID=A0ABD2W0N9_9HYME